jgi:hypothetical protein
MPHGHDSKMTRLIATQGTLNNMSYNCNKTITNHKLDFQKHTRQYVQRGHVVSKSSSVHMMTTNVEEEEEEEED